jgi:hypothetical protein
MFFNVYFIHTGLLPFYNLISTKILSVRVNHFLEGGQLEKQIVLFLIIQLVTGYIKPLNFPWTVLLLSKGVECIIIQF